MSKTTTIGAAVLGFALVAACAAAPPSPGAPETPEARAGHGPLPFLHDDWPAALAQAQASELPIFVETWAPW